MGMPLNYKIKLRMFITAILYRSMSARIWTKYIIWLTMEDNKGFRTIPKHNQTVFKENIIQVAI